MLPGQGELDQINKIFRAVGAPSEDKWPGFSSFPLANKITWKASTKGKLRYMYSGPTVAVLMCTRYHREMFPANPFSGGVYLDDYGLDLLQKLLTMDPNQVARHFCITTANELVVNRELRQLQRLSIHGWPVKLPDPLIYPTCQDLMELKHNSRFYVYCSHIRTNYPNASYYFITKYL
jgi:hypothetical protein